ncbi:NAD(P)-binding protein [Aspergillus candidus]|uniref:NAD(P)-binding protein n=1 Tax=Aspergillus candidus TaxID=41067 RepID=A0A2I2F928_ASPCN|nr:NAD(P)-binding protein [Aspergillus candidus]PLB37144.1 NAD(P)-binding protein [Aspergillus candidus]
MTFNPQLDIPALTDKVILVTGATEGLGKQTILDLAQHHPAKIYLAARSRPKAEAALKDIQTKAGPNCAPIALLDLDLASLDSVARAAEKIKAQESRLDILIANAGVLGAKGATKDGYEIQFGVNHLGHALLIRLLLPLLMRTAQRDDVAVGETRVVIVGSLAEKLAAPADVIYPFAELERGEAPPMMGMMARYGLSKLANVHYAAQLARHYPEGESGVRFVALHPGAVRTNLGEMLKTWPRVQSALRGLVGMFFGLVPVEEGVLGQLWAATWPVGRVDGIGEPRSGVFYHPVGVEGGGTPLAYDEGKAGELWEWTENVLRGHLEGA